MGVRVSVWVFVCEYVNASVLVAHRVCASAERETDETLRREVTDRTKQKSRLMI